MGPSFRLERRLMEHSPFLHDRYRSCIAVSTQMLARYVSVFPEYTDHTVLHAMEIKGLCEDLMGEQADRLSAEEIYVLLMGALFHDAGMGISYGQAVRFMEDFGLPKIEPGDTDAIQELIRSYHHEISGWYVWKHWEIFDIPNRDYAHAVVQVCRGHRKVDLLDETGYPPLLEVEPGVKICLPYLSALLRLADEMDMAAHRNFSFLYEGLEYYRSAESRFEFAKHEAIRSVCVCDDHILVSAETGDPLVAAGVKKNIRKLKQTVGECCRVVRERTAFTLNQTQVRLLLNGKPESYEEEPARGG